MIAGIDRCPARRCPAWRCPARRRQAWVAATLPSLLLVACASVYSASLEPFGVQRRADLTQAVQAAGEQQESARDQFQATLGAFRRATAFQGSALEQAYETLGGELRRCEARATDVHASLAALDDVTTGLFTTWQDEAQAFPQADERQKSESLLAETRERCEKVLVAAHRAAAGMQLVLDGYRDQVLFLAQNLNAGAIAALQERVAGLETAVTRWLAEVDASVAESRAFVQSLD